MKVRKREPWRTLFTCGLRIVDLYDLMDRAGTYTFRLTKRYINIPLTAAATGLLGNEVGGEAFDWEKLIYMPLLGTAAICGLGVALKVPNFLSAAKRNFARLQGQVNMVQLKRKRRLQHAETLWSRLYVYHTRQHYGEAEMAAAEAKFLADRERLIGDLEAGLSATSIDHLEMEDLDESGRRSAMRRLALAMEYETPASPGVERCKSAFLRTLRYSLRSEESQRQTQERSGYDFREYKTWLRQTFFDHAQPPLAAHLGTDFRLRCIRTQLRRDGVGHTVRVREDWYVFPGLAQRFWHANTIRKVNLKVGAALSRLSIKYCRSLSVQAILWPDNWRGNAFQVTAEDGRCLGEELRTEAQRIVRKVYGRDRKTALLMLDRATLNNFIQTKGLRVLTDYAYCSGEGLDQDYLDDLRRLGCDGELLDAHSRWVRDAQAAMRGFLEWLSATRPELREDSRQRALLQDAFHRNWNGLREAVPDCSGRQNVHGFRFWRRWRRQRLGASRAEELLDELARPEVQASLQEELDAIRTYDALAHLEHDTYAELIENLADYAD